ncbi:MAG: phasin family protein [Drouetiella hepatica Uher 2000/2452]|jgi:polyhydroxyalkanoate synthesis regulator phasin|uniref:Phasin family protein n=1 Tax=Drouetiella hepatica Uher 2000/2452 TaxID=904376 RepID=A0A951Q9U3_9CYAN|nr:phasin family protein [Drouetiella hepatica Uher 2000/2452]
MANFGDLVQKAFYLGVGVASYAAEKAGTTLGELRSQAQKIADEMVARGEMTADEAKHMVDEMVSRAQKDAVSGNAAATPEPRRIEILDDEVSVDSQAEDSQAESRVAGSPQADSLRDQVAKLQEELRRLKRD